MVRKRSKAGEVIMLWGPCYGEVPQIKDLNLFKKIEKGPNVEKKKSFLISILYLLDTINNNICQMFIQSPVEKRVQNGNQKVVGIDVIIVHSIAGNYRNSEK